MSRVLSTCDAQDLIEERSAQCSVELHYSFELTRQHLCQTEFSGDELRTSAGTSDQRHDSHIAVSDLVGTRKAVPGSELL